MCIRTRFPTFNEFMPVYSNACNSINVEFVVFLTFFLFIFFFIFYYNKDNERREHLLNVLKQKAEQNAQYKTSTANGKAFEKFSIDPVSRYSVKEISFPLCRR